MEEIFTFDPSPTGGTFLLNLQEQTNVGEGIFTMVAKDAATFAYKEVAKTGGVPFDVTRTKDFSLKVTIEYIDAGVKPKGKQKADAPAE